MKKEIQGSVEHSKKVYREDGKLVQLDRLEVNIPITAVDKEGLLDYWCVDDFDYAYIDRVSGEIVIVYTTKHYLPHEYEVDSEEVGA